jgi:mRNA interferase HigB
MLLVNADRLADAADEYADARRALAAWQRVVEETEWKHLQDVRTTYVHADAVQVDSGKTVTVFNIKGNYYRLLTAIDYKTGVVNVLLFLTHAEYSKDRWKKTL